MGQHLGRRGFIITLVGPVLEDLLAMDFGPKDCAARDPLREDSGE